MECSVALQLAPALLLLPGKRRTRVQVTEAEEVSSEVGIGDSGGRHVSCNTVTCNTCNVYHRTVDPGPGGDPRAGQGVQVRALPQLCHHRPLQPEEDPLILALDSPMERMDICIYQTTFTLV